MLTLLPWPNMRSMATPGIWVMASATSVLGNLPRSSEVTASTIESAERLICSDCCKLALMPTTCTACNSWTVLLRALPCSCSPASDWGSAGCYAVDASEVCRVGVAFCACAEAANMSAATMPAESMVLRWVIEKPPAKMDERGDVQGRVKSIDWQQAVRAGAEARFSRPGHQRLSLPINETTPHATNLFCKRCTYPEDIFAGALKTTDLLPGRCAVVAR